MLSDGMDLIIIKLLLEFNGIPHRYIKRIDIDIEDLGVTLDPDSERLRKCHDRMRRKAAGISDIYTGPSDRSLKEPHRVEMPYELHRTVFGKLDSQFHSVLSPGQQIPLIMLPDFCS